MHRARLVTRALSATLPALYLLAGCQQLAAYQPDLSRDLQVDAAVAFTDGGPRDSAAPDLPGDLAADGEPDAPPLTPDAATGCDVDCVRPHTTASCQASACVGFTCASGWGNCDGDWNNGCEVNTQSSLAHCGSCGAACTPNDNQVGTCNSGKCTIRRRCSLWSDWAQAPAPDGCTTFHGTPACQYRCTIRPGKTWIIKCTSAFGVCSCQINASTAHASISYVAKASCDATCRSPFEKSGFCVP